MAVVIGLVKILPRQRQVGRPDIPKFSPSPIYPAVNVNLEVKTAAARSIAGSIRSFRFVAPMTMTSPRSSIPASGRELRHNRLLNIGGNPRTARRHQRLHFVNKNEGRGAFFGAAEKFADIVLRPTEPVNQLGAVNGEKFRPNILPVLSLTNRESSLAKRPGDKRFTAAGRTLKQNPLGARSFVTAESFGSQIRKKNLVFHPESAVPGPPMSAKVSIGISLNEPIGRFRFRYSFSAAIKERPVSPESQNVVARFPALRHRGA